MIDPSNIGHFDHKKLDRQELLQNMPKGLGGSLFLSNLAKQDDGGLFFSMGTGTPSM
jgi:hypothetical protein